jgi:hypothetical protein
VKKICSSAKANLHFLYNYSLVYKFQSAIVAIKKSVCCEKPSRKEIKEGLRIYLLKNFFSFHVVVEPVNVQNVAQDHESSRSHIESGNATKNAAWKILAKEARRQRKTLAKMQDETLLPGLSNVPGTAVASSVENKKKRKQRHRQLFRMRQSNFPVKDSKL